MATTSKARLARSLSVLALGVGAAIVPTRSASAADGFANAGTLAISAEDMTGYFARSLKYWNENDRTVEFSRSSFSLGMATGGVRLGLHYFLLKQVSLGGTLGFEHVSGSNTYQDDPGTWSTNVPSETRVVIASRIGYALMFTDSVGIWFRGGLGYEQNKRRMNDTGQNYARDSFAMLSADILFVWSFVQHFGLFIGPTADRSFVGRHYEHDDDGNWSNDARWYRLGVTSGLVGYF
jgi:hypothetical protein